MSQGAGAGGRRGGGTRVGHRTGPEQHLTQNWTGLNSGPAAMEASEPFGQIQAPNTADAEIIEA